MTTLYLIEGPFDGETLEDETVPDRITFPGLPMVSIYNSISKQEELAYQQVVYQRIDNTYNYICVSCPK